MKRHPTIPLVQVAGGFLIVYLCRHPELQKKVVDEGGIKALVNAMENHKHERKVQWCLALRTLLCDVSSTFAQAAVEANCIVLVFRARTRFIAA
jgi:hypothetical protein